MTHVCGTHRADSASLAADARQGELDGRAGLPLAEPSTQERMIVAAARAALALAAFEADCDIESLDCERAGLLLRLSRLAPAQRHRGALAGVRLRRRLAELDARRAARRARHAAESAAALELMVRRLAAYRAANLASRQDNCRPIHFAGRALVRLVRELKGGSR